MCSSDLASTSMVASVRSAVWAVAGVNDVYVSENDTSTPISLGETNYPIPAHCLYVCVSGGADEDIAHAIQGRKSAKKNGGCGCFLILLLLIVILFGGIFALPEDTLKLLPGLDRVFGVEKVQEAQ